MQGIKVNRLGLPVIMIPIAALGTAPGLSHPLPIGRPVAGARKASAIDEGLGQVNGMTIGGLPIMAQSPQTEREDLGSQRCVPT